MPNSKVQSGRSRGNNKRLMTLLPASAGSQAIGDLQTYNNRECPLNHGSLQRGQLRLRVVARSSNLINTRFSGVGQVAD